MGSWIEDKIIGNALKLQGGHASPTSVLRKMSPSCPSSDEKQRFPCVWCFKHFSRADILADHLEKANHNEHEPRCHNCKKYFRTLESLREHLHGHVGGLVAKRECSAAYNERGCPLCLTFLCDPISRDIHLQGCKRFRASAIVQDPNWSPFGHAPPSGRWGDSEPPSPTWTDSSSSSSSTEGGGRAKRGAVAIDCEMVGGGEGGEVDLCARVAVVDENENVLMNTFVMPAGEVTDYRTSISGILPSDLEGAPPLREIRARILQILANPLPADEAESGRGGAGQGRVSIPGGGWDRRRRLLVGHDLRHDLACLGFDYPHSLIRDTAWYPPLKRTNGQVHSLKYLAATYLGYEIQKGECHHPSEDAIASLRLYCRMRNRTHPPPPNHAPTAAHPPPFGMHLIPFPKAVVPCGGGVGGGMKSGKESGTVGQNARNGGKGGWGGEREGGGGGERSWRGVVENVPRSSPEDCTGGNCQLEWRQGSTPFNGPERPKPKFRCWCQDK